MSKKLNVIHKRIMDCIENGSMLAPLYKDRQPFDFPCPNNDCSGKNGSRQMALAWKNNNGGYSIYCYVCGQEEEMSKKDFKNLKKILDSEDNKNIGLQNKKCCIVNSSNYYEEEYLDGKFDK